MIMKPEKAKCFRKKDGFFDPPPLHRILTRPGLQADGQYPYHPRITFALRSSPQGEGARIDVATPLPGVLGHDVLLLQVVENLLSNAVKFVAPGVSPRVSIRAERKDALVRVWVEDNGIGIPAQYHDRVFGVFERLNRPEEYPGTGIGLAIVRRAVQRMDGRIGFESEVGRGSRFWIELSAAV